eukprot:SAG11_NODE_18526_length_488_cov_1.542416_1_plen_43_part_10
MRMGPVALLDTLHYGPTCDSFCIYHCSWPVLLAARELDLPELL